MTKDYFKHELAVVESNNIGKNTRIWALAHVLPGAKIGSNCNICDHTFIENDVIDIFKHLSKLGIRTYISNEKTSVLYFKKIKKKNILRVSFHYFNTKKEIDCLVKVLNDLK